MVSAHVKLLLLLLENHILPYRALLGMWFISFSGMKKCVSVSRRAFACWGPVGHLTGGGNTRVGWIARLFLPKKKCGDQQRVCFGPLARRGRGREGDVEGKFWVWGVHNAGGGPPGEGNHHEAGNSQHPPPPPTPQPHSHKDTPLRRHGCAFVLWVCPTPGGWRGTPGCPLNH